VNEVIGRWCVELTSRRRLYVADIRDGVVYMSLLAGGPIVTVATLHRFMTFFELER
jgi:hypothetical protein